MTMGPSEHVHGCIGHHYGNMQDYECVDGMQVDVRGRVWGGS